MAIATLTNRTPMSRAQFDRIPEGPPYFDYIRGEAIEVNKPTCRHQEIELEMAVVLKRHVKANGLGVVYHQIDVELPSKDCVGPDIVFIATEHLSRYGEELGDLYGAPDLIVEISSPSTFAYDRIDKFGLYCENRVPWVWMVEQQSLLIEEYQWSPDGYIHKSGVMAGQIFKPLLFPGLEIDLENLMGEEAGVKSD